MEVAILPLPDIKLLEPYVFRDARGWSMESYSAEQFRAIGIQDAFVLRYESYNEKTGTLRGIHFQDGPAAQNKLVQCIQGAVWDVAVDLRPDSPTYKQWTAVELSGENKKMLYLPIGFGHGFVTLAAHTRIVYLLDSPFSLEHAKSIAWNDPTLNISWPIESPILSEKDEMAPRLNHCKIDFKSGRGYYEL